MRSGRPHLRARKKDASMCPLKIPGLFPIQRIARYLPLLPVALIIGCIAHYGVNVPVADDWALSSLVSKAAHHKVQIKQLFQQHNEHRVFFLKLVVASIARMSHWDLRLQMYLSVLLCGITTCNVFVLMKRTLSLSAGPGSALGLCVSVLLFSPIQYENWLWGFQVAFFLLPLCLSSSWVVLTSNLRFGAKFALSAVLMAIATFSFSTGAFGWLLSFPLFVVTDGQMERRKAIRWIGYWLLGAGACVGLYLFDYHEPGHSTRILTGFHPFPYAEYAIVFLGGNLFRSATNQSTTLPFILGLFLTVLFVVLLGYLFKVSRSRELKRRGAPWVAFGTFAMASGGLCALGRRPYFPVQQALESRYTTFSLMLVVSLLGLLVLAYRHLRATFPERTAKTLPWIAGAGIAILAAGYTLSVPFSFEQMANLRSSHLDGKAALQYSRVLRDPGMAEAIMTATLFPDIGMLRGFVEMLDAVDRFRPPLIKDPRMHDDTASPGAKKRSGGRFDSIAAVDNQYVVSGWAILPERHERADGIVLAFLNSAGEWIALTMAAERTERSDINTMVGDRSLKNIGWRARFPAAILPPEAHELSAWAIDGKTGKSYKLDGSQKVP